MGESVSEESFCTFLKIESRTPKKKRSSNQGMHRNHSEEDGHEGVSKFVFTYQVGEDGAKQPICHSTDGNQFSQ
jgi:hypothetical protein